MPPEGGGSQVQVSADRVDNCRKSAAFWVNELPRYADRQQQLADFWAISAGILAALTSLSIFPVLGDGSTDIEKGAISIAAFLAAVCALIPRIKNYAEFAGQARELSSRYGSVVGELIDLAQASPIPQEAARTILTEFESIKEKKDALRGLRDRDTIELRRTEQERKLVEARARLDEAKKAAGPAGR
jgi:hypothetical protein